MVFKTEINSKDSENSQAAADEKVEERVTKVKQKANNSNTSISENPANDLSYKMVLIF